jgi:hypothetical protein
MRLPIGRSALLAGLISWATPTALQPTPAPVAVGAVQDYPRPYVAAPWDDAAATYPATRLQRITAYNALASQTDSTPTLASCGRLADAPGHVVAVSRDLLYTPDGRKRCGQEVAVVYDDGTIVLGVIWDTMNRRYRAAADILLPTRAEALQHGVQTGHLIMLD